VTGQALLFDENLSPRLVEHLRDVFPASVHVRDAGLASADDEAVWNHAAANGLVIVSKDSDFHQRSFLFGAPPKVIWIRRGNCSTAVVADLMRSAQPAIAEFLGDAAATFLVLD
jgi:predicted nuclease of predicted toxin-antitoxin system